MSISNLEKRAGFKRRYYVIYIPGIISLLIGFFIANAISFIPIISFYEPGWEQYDNLVENLGTLWTLFLNLGLFLFSLSTFIGGMTDKRVTVEVRRGMLVTSVIVSIALVIFNFVSYFFS